jgi:hypothetical protein
VLSRGPYNILHIFSSPECSLINMALQATWILKATLKVRLSDQEILYLLMGV